MPINGPSVLTMGYVVAFNRDRDSYQLPLALHEQKLLTRFVTDCYYPDSPLMRAIPGMGRIRHRRTEGLPASLTTSSLKAVALQAGHMILSKDPTGTVFDCVHSVLSRTALQEAINSDSDLFLYSEHAFEAFSTPASRNKRKGLFVFHPHPKLIRELLTTDFAAHPECLWSMRTEAETSSGNRRCELIDEEWRHADFIVCASSFTATSLVHAGCPRANIHIVPYGSAVNPIARANGRPVSGPCRFLFVGQGVQRKGLHHLFVAWKKAALRNAELTVVAARIDPAIARMAPAGVDILPKQSKEGLRALFGAAHIFVLPSIVEGFGLVLLEALSAGCYCIGTPNTGLADLECPSQVGCITPAGDTDQLAATLAHACDLLKQHAIDFDAIAKWAQRWSWERFRSTVGQIARDQLRAIHPRSDLFAMSRVI